MICVFLCTKCYISSFGVPMVFGVRTIYITGSGEHWLLYLANTGAIT